MKKIKRLLALCLMLILALCLFAGCGKKSYEVLVTDQGGSPLAGVAVQFCSDTECIMGQTDAKGIAVFEKGAGKYTVHILSVPQGYILDKTEYPAPSEPGRMTIKIDAEKRD